MVHTILYQLGKKNNSTKRPDYTNVGREEIGEFKGVASVLSPVITYNFGNLEIAPQYNYVGIDEFDRFYFITEWVYTNGLWVAYTAVDVLATYKTEILQLNKYLLRSASFRNVYVQDTLFPASTDMSTMYNYIDHPFRAYTFQSGTFVVGIMNDDAGLTGAVKYYGFSPLEYSRLMSALLASIDYMGIDAAEVGTQLQKALINPMQYIISSMYLPLDMSEYAQSQTIGVGWWDLGTYTAVKINNLVPMYRVFTNVIEIPKHPQTETIGDVWINSSPYSTYTLEYFPFGSLPLDSARIINYSHLWLEVKIDFMTGAALLQVYNAVVYSGESEYRRIGAPVLTATAQLGVPMQLAQISYDFSQLNAGTAAASVAAGVISGNVAGIDKISTTTTEKIGSVPVERDKFGRKIINVAEEAERLEVQTTQQKIENITAGIGNALNSAMANATVRGTTGGLMMFSTEVRVCGYFYNIVPRDTEHFGRPACRFADLSDVNGFIKCLDGHVEISRATNNEKDLIQAFLEGGCYIE